MSGQATGWVLRHGPQPAHVDRDGRKYGARARGLRAVLVAVADAADRHGHNAHPGIDNVAAAALYSRRQTIELLAELVAEGWLTIESEGGGRGNATVYRVPIDEETVQPTLHGIRAVDNRPRGAERVQSERETVQSRLHPNGLATVTTPQTPQRGAVDSAGESPGQLRLFELVDHVLKIAADSLQLRARHRARWCTEHRPRAHELAMRWPTAPPAVIAQAVLGNARQLAHYPQEPSTR